MTVKELAGILNAKLECGTGDRQVTCGYCGDLLSRIMGSAPAESAWVTVMGNVNAVAVAVLADISCIILAEGALLDTDARQKAEMQDVTILSSDDSMFHLCVKIDHALQG